MFIRDRAGRPQAGGPRGALKGRAMCRKFS